MTDLLLQACIECWNLRSSGSERQIPLDKSGIYGNITPPFTFITTLSGDHVAESYCNHVLVLATFQQGNVGYLCGVWFYMEHQTLGPIIRPFYKYNISQWNPHEAKFKLHKNHLAAIELNVDGVWHTLVEIKREQPLPVYDVVDEVYPTQCRQCNGKLINIRTHFNSPKASMYLYQPAMCDHCQVRYSRSDRRWVCTRPSLRKDQCVQPCYRAAPCNCSTDTNWIKHDNIISTNEIERIYTY